MAICGTGVNSVFWSVCLGAIIDFIKVKKHYMCFKHIHFSESFKLQNIRMRLCVYMCCVCVFFSEAWLESSEKSLK